MNLTATLAIEVGVPPLAGPFMLAGAAYAAAGARAVGHAATRSSPARPQHCRRQVTPRWETNSGSTGIDRRLQVTLSLDDGRGRLRAAPAS